MGNTRNTGYLQNAIKVSDAGAISFMSGSTMLATLNTTGQLSGSSPVLSSSYALNATSASYAVSASNATNAVTASFANAFTVANTLTATTLVVQTVSSSVIYSSGSNVFGNSQANTQVFTGSVYMNPGGLFVSSSGNVGIGTSTVVEGTQPASSISIFPNSSVSNGPLIQFAGNGRIRPADAGNRLSIDGNALHLNSYIGGNIIMNTAGGNVGIGTNSPLVLFDIRQPYAKTDTTRRDILYASNESSPSGLRVSIVGGASQAVRSAHLQTTDWGTTNDGSIVLQPFGGNVGIGIENPSSILYISAQSDTVGGNGIRLGNSGVNRIWNTRFGTNTDLSYNLDFYDGSTWSNRLKLTYTGTLSVANRGIATSSMPAGSVIQVVSSANATGFSTSSSSDTDTGLTLSITPTSSTSKILVIITAYVRATTGGGNCYIYSKVFRGASALTNGYAAMGNFNSSDIRGVDAINYLDSPATTSPTTYKYTLNSQFAATVYMNSSTTPSIITLMEIAQ